MQRPLTAGVRRRPVLLLLIGSLPMVLALLVLLVPRAEAQGGCFGRGVNFFGTNGPDMMTGTDPTPQRSGGDTIDGQEGNDSIDGRGGNDFLCGGQGDDILRGSSGSDRLSGGAGRDTLSGGPDIGDHADYADHGLPVNVTLDDIANDGASGEGDNILSDVEIVSGGAVGDNLTGGAGAERLLGENGKDTLNGGGGRDALDGGLGDDTLQLREGIRDERADCDGGDFDTADLDLRDAGLIFPNTPIATLSCETVTIGAVREGPNVRISRRSVRLTRSGARIRLTCPRGLGSRCSGRLRLRSARKVRVGGRRRIVRLGSPRYRIAPGGTEYVRVGLSRRNRRLVRRLKRLRVEARAVENGRLGQKITIQSLVLKTPR